MEYPCPENCEKSPLDGRGFKSHLKLTHDYSPAEADAAFDLAKHKAGLDPEPAVDGENGESPSPASHPQVQTSVSGEDDESLRRLDRQIEETRRIVALQNMQDMLADDESDDLLDRLAQYKELLGDDGRDRDIQALQSELRSIRSLLRENAGGRSEPQPSVQLSGSDPLSAAIAANGGEMGADELAVIAEAANDPEAEAAKYDYKKAELKMESRREMVDAALDKVGDVLPAVFEGLSQVAERRAQQQQQRTRRQPRQPVAAGQQPARAEPAQTAAEEPREEPEVSRARRRFEDEYGDVQADDDADETETAETEGDGPTAAATDGGDIETRQGEFRGPSRDAADDNGGGDDE